MKEDPYSSISVVWLDQESNPRRWFYAYQQLDNLCSPWDLQLSAFVLPENVRPVILPHALTLGCLTAKTVLSYLQR